jgi:hypothetical protein
MVDYDYGKCLTCEHWLGNVYVGKQEYNFEAVRHVTGKCTCRGNPHWHNDDVLSANDGCQFWGESPLVRAAKKYHEERERNEREHQEWLATEEGQRWQAEEKQRKEEEHERKKKNWAINEIRTIRNRIIRCILSGVIGLLFCLLMANTGGELGIVGYFFIIIFSVCIGFVIGWSDDSDFGTHFAGAVMGAFYGAISFAIVFYFGRAGFFSGVFCGAFTGLIIGIFSRIFNDKIAT